MPKITYAVKNFRESTLDIIRTADRICREYADQGYDLTLRQLYYQFVARGLLPNSDKSYKQLGNTVNEARLAGLIDWKHLVDRTRNLEDEARGWRNPTAIISASADQYRRNLWDASYQPYRPEVWVEKEALAGVVGRTCERLRVPYFSCRGYVSQSEMWAAGQRLRRYHNDQDATPIIIHLGDHDPSGLDMTRDIRERLTMFVGQPVEVQRIALNWDQIEEFNPPPNPAKLTDSRGSAYVEEYGYESWELDALDPATLDRLIEGAVTPLLNDVTWGQADAEDEGNRERMREVADRWPDIMDRWAEIEEVLDR